MFLSTFDYAMAEAGAKGYYLPVKNDTQGINQPFLDNTAMFGSAGKLQGTIDMGNVLPLAANPYGPRLDQMITTLSHELMHRWGAHAVFKAPDGNANFGLLGQGNTHWSYLLDTKGSIMYGNGWKDNKDGTFTSTSVMSGYSPLDLYLMGMIDKSRVPPMTLIDNPAIDKTKLPELGATISGTAKTVTIEDIVAALGERIPNAATSPKKFNIGFVLLTRPGTSAGNAPEAIETLRSAWAGRFVELTQGISGINGVAPSLNVNIDTPAGNATITGPDVSVTGTVINSTGAETGITVNGIPATINGSHFIANHVPLTEGANTITITATNANGLTSTTTRTVTAQAGHYIRITSNMDSGTGPLTVSLRLVGSFSIVNPSVSIAGPVAVTPVFSESQTEFTANLKVEGEYTITASAVGNDGNTYTDSVTVTVVSRYQLESLLKAKWEGMKAKITAGDIQGSGAYFPTASRQMFQSLFSDANINGFARLNEVKEIEIYSGAGGFAQGGLIRQDDDGIFSYPLTYSKDELGIWRIYNF